MKNRVVRIHSSGGFTLIETLVALTLLGLTLSALGMVTNQWLRNWDHGFARVQRADALGTALDRLASDIAAALFILPNRDAKRPLFNGSEFALTFVRTSQGPNARPGLDVVHIAELVDNLGRALVRSQAPFVPFAADPVVDALDFSDPVALIRAPYRVSFAYAGRDGKFRAAWQNGDELPTSVRLFVRDMTDERISLVSTATTVHVDLAVNVICPIADGGCGRSSAATSPPQNNNSNGSTGAVPPSSRRRG